MMSFNMKRDLLPFGRHVWHKRAGQAAELIRRAAPDILGTQELTEGPLGDMERLLPEYQWVGEGRGGGRKGEYTAIFFRREKFQLMSQQTFWLSPTPEQPSRDWTTPFPRICTWCELQPVDSPDRPVSQPRKAGAGLQHPPGPHQLFCQGAGTAADFAAHLRTVWGGPRPGDFDGRL